MESERASSLYCIEQTGLTASEKSASIFQPDALLALQYFEERRRKALEPEERLVLAILEDAIDCFQENHLARQGRRKQLFDEVQKWIFQGHRDWVFGFENICAVLGFEPEYIREGLVRWRKREISKHRNPRLERDQLVTRRTYGQIAVCAAS
jgi:hypothetical protein